MTTPLALQEDRSARLARSHDPKHDRYRDAFCPDDLFWGIGVENETYVELTEGLPVTAAFFNNQQRERYSVNYWTQYKEGCVRSVLDAWMAELPAGPDTPLRLPLLVNGHTFTKCDRMGEHRTTYAKIPAPNPRFKGQTLWEMLQDVDPAVFREGHDHWWTFDGDTVEFMTQGFYRATIEDVVAELIAAKQRWMEALRKGLRSIGPERLLRQPVDWPKANYGFAAFLSNRRNVAIFNNGTYHINLTAPTRLDKNGEIADWPRFQHVHQIMARFFQWLTPLFVARFGSADPFAHLAADARVGQRFPTGSQRLTASRYVSAGTYDTVQMPRGKLLTLPIASRLLATNDAQIPHCAWDFSRSARDIMECQPPLWWHVLHAHPDCAYKVLEQIGFDINFNKFHNHGLEFRIFDWFPESELLDVLRLLVWFLDAATAVGVKEPPLPQTSPTWNAVLLRCLWEGTWALLDTRECAVFERALGLVKGSLGGPVDAYTAYGRVFEAMATRYNHKKTGCSGAMIHKALLRPIPYRGDWISEDVENVEHVVKHVVRVRFVKVPATAFRSKRPAMQSPHPAPAEQNESHRPRRWWTGFRKMFRRR